MSGIKKHNYNELQLKGMKVADLKKVVREHNLHTAITNYSKLRKADLISKMMKYAGKKATGKTKLALEEDKKWSDGAKMGDGPITKKKQKANGKTKAIVPELGKPMYKEGLLKGVKKQFQRKQKPAVKTRPQRQRRAPPRLIAS